MRGQVLRRVIGCKQNITDRLGAMRIASNTGCIVSLIKLSLL
jgi:hypothetical protein